MKFKSLHSRKDCLVYHGLNHCSWGRRVNGTEEHPKAFVNILIFDKNHKFLDIAFDQINGGEQIDLSPKAAHDYLMKEYTVREAGYAFVYIFDESPTQIDVYFDDVTMTHTKSNIIQYNACLPKLQRRQEYYPFGLQTSSSWTREGSSNNYLYNEASELNQNSGWYETFFRGYDPTLGRFHQVDPLAHALSSLSPYNYAGNDPVYFNDPNGDYVQPTMASDRPPGNDHTATMIAGGISGFDNVVSQMYGGDPLRGSGGGYFGKDGPTADQYLAMQGEENAADWVARIWGIENVRAGVTYSPYETSQYRGDGDTMYGNEEGTRFLERGISRKEAIIWAESLNPENNAPNSWVPIYGDIQSASYWAEKGDWTRVALYGASAASDLLGLSAIAKTAVKSGTKLLARNAAKGGTNAFKHNFKYADRVRVRAVQDPVSHNFPYSFDDAVLSTKPILKNNGYKIFQQSGTMNGKNGVFEIGLTKDGIIDHRFFRPIK